MNKIFSKNNLISHLLIVALLLFESCGVSKEEYSLKTGTWTGTIYMQKNVLNFEFEIQKNQSSYNISLKNGKEKLQLDDVIVKKDSIKFTFHIFDALVKASFTDDGMKGVYKKNYIDNYELPFTAKFGSSEIIDTTDTFANFGGRWDMTFTGDQGERSQGVGIFEQHGNRLSGTILTAVGDYRYLDGFVDNSTFTLYSFDGNHAFIFKGTHENNSTIKGDFWSGKDFHESFIGLENEKAELPDANKLTFLKDGYEQLEFTFPNLEGNPVSLNDNRFKNQVVILQIFGTWCPNCMDETIFLNQWYKENKSLPVQLIGLAYETKDDFNYAKKRVETMIEKLDVEYDFLIAGTADKTEASKTLPMLNHIMSFPTTIFIDKKGQIRKIHTGFSGPATGTYYLNFKKEFEEFTKKLLME